MTILEILDLFRQRKIVNIWEEVVLCLF